MNDKHHVPRKHERYDEALNRAAVELWLQGGRSVPQSTAELGISDQSLKQ